MKEKIPEDWKVIPLGDETHLEIISGGTPSSKKKDYWGGSVLWATPTDITSLRGNTIRNTEKTITGDGLKNSSARLLPRGSVLMTTRATIGEVAINEEPMATNQGFQNFICKEGTHNWYLLYTLQYHKNHISRLGGQSTFKEVPKSMLKKYKIPLPLMPEQKHIAEVLSTVDDAIQRADEAIAGTERLKRGLMQRLLTEGIGHKEFKDSPIGKIPEEWEVVNLKEITTSFISGGTPSTKNLDYWGGNIQWMTSASIDGRIIGTGVKTITEEGLKNSATKIVPKNSILIATRVGIGKVAINRIDIAISQDLTGVVFDSNLSDVEFIYWVILSHAQKFKRLAQGSTIKGIVRKDLEKIKVILPPLTEQKRISEVLSTADRKLELERERKSTLERIKLGFMNDLLTGRKRVKVSS